MGAPSALKLGGERAKISPMLSSKPIWIPDAATIAAANLTRYREWLLRERDFDLADYRALHRWSIEDLPAFWESLFAFCDLRHHDRWQTPLASREMPGARWFPGCTLNYAENIFAKRHDGHPMLLYADEGSALHSLSWADAARQVAALAACLRELGVRRGDRVVAYLPNIPEAVIALLATSSIGAIWSSCAPEFGSQSVLERFQQIEPKLLLAVPEYRYNGQRYDRRDALARLQAQLPTLEHTILIRGNKGETRGASSYATLGWEEALSRGQGAALEFAALPFDHPLWVLFSSGTTGKPKPIVQGHGGITLEHAKATIFHNDLRPGDRFFWYTSTGWMMWNYLVGGLFTGATIILYDGSPTQPDLGALFQLAERSGMNYLGSSAAFLGACMKAGLRPNQRYDLSQLRALGATGSPLSADGYDWFYGEFAPNLTLEPLSGGTDLCTAFIGGARTEPLYRGEMQGASLGADIRAYDEAGRAVSDEVGELVIAQPMPSMPLYFWNDPDGERYRASYFERYDGVWRHGDWLRITPRGGCVIYGRSDSTINRQGFRMGTSEIYRVVEAFTEVQDSLIIDLELLGRASFTPLFLVLQPGQALDDELQSRIRAALREQISPRHVPDAILTIDEVPYTLSGKKMEVPIRKILLGMPLAEAANPGAMRNPESLDFFERYAEELATHES